MLKSVGKSGITVGQLARAAAVNVETVRYYQRIGLLTMPRRDYGSIRRYLADDLKRIRFIKRAQKLGFSLDEVALLLGLSDGKHCQETKVLAQTRLAVVEEKIADLAAIEKAQGLGCKVFKGQPRMRVPGYRCLDRGRVVTGCLWSVRISLRTSAHAPRTHHGPAPRTYGAPFA